MSGSKDVGSWTGKDSARVLREPTAADHKYSRGVLGLRTGSEAYPGAAVLGVEAAARTGAGTDAGARSAAETAALREILDGDVPVIVDAGALDLAVDARAARIVTPH